MRILGGNAIFKIMCGSLNTKIGDPGDFSNLITVHAHADNGMARSTSQLFFFTGRYRHSDLYGMECN